MFPPPLFLLRKYLFCIRKSLQVSICEQWAISGKEEVRIAGLGRWGERNDLYPGKSQTVAIREQDFHIDAYVLFRPHQETEFLWFWTHSRLRENFPCSCRDLGSEVCFIFLVTWSPFDKSWCFYLFIMVNILRFLLDFIFQFCYVVLANMWELV